MNTSRQKLDSAIIALIFTLLVAGLIMATVIKRDSTDTPVPLTTAIDILEEKAEPIPTVCTFGGCPVAKPVTTEPEATELIFQEPEPEEYYAEPAYEEEVFEHYEEAPQASAQLYSPSYFRTMGLVDYNGWTWSWYSERVLPGTGLDIPGRYTDDMGYVRDCDGYICVASDVLAYGTVIDSPFGSPAKVYDCGVGHNDWVDVYVGW